MRLVVNVCFCFVMFSFTHGRSNHRRLPTAATTLVANPPKRPTARAPQILCASGIDAGVEEFGIFKCDGISQNIRAEATEKPPRKAHGVRALPRFMYSFFSDA